MARRAYPTTFEERVAISERSVGLVWRTEVCRAELALGGSIISILGVAGYQAEAHTRFTKLLTHSEAAGTSGARTAAWANLLTSAGLLAGRIAIRGEAGAVSGNGRPAWLRVGAQGDQAHGAGSRRFRASKSVLRGRLGTLRAGGRPCCFGQSPNHDDSRCPSIWRSRGKTTVKVLPTPSVLSTVTVPPCSVTISLTT
jgi:hypothetical protein